MEKAGIYPLGTVETEEEERGEWQNEAMDEIYEKFEKNAYHIDNGICADPARMYRHDGVSAFLRDIRIYLRAQYHQLLP